MKKNEVIRETIMNLMLQREASNKALLEMDFNQNSNFDKKNTIEANILALDGQISNYINLLD